MAAPSILIPCVYCRTRPAEPGEHALPAALGRFPLFGASKRILCKAAPSVGERGCNERITGPLFDRMFRRGALSHFRRQLPFGVGRSARLGSRSSGLGYEPATIEHDGVRVPVEIDQGGGSPRISLGVVLRGCEGTRRFIRIADDIRTGDDLRALLCRLGLRESVPTSFIDDETGRIRAVLSDVWPDAPLSAEPKGQIGGKLTAELDWSIGDQERQAVAAIAFHVLLDLSDLCGGEQRFSVIRNVIMGRLPPGDVVTVTRPGGPQPYTLDDEIPERPKHILIYGPSADGHFVCLLRFFIGAGEQTPWFRVVVCRDVAPESQRMCVALAYFSDKPRIVDGREFDGEVLAVEASGTRLRVRRDAERLIR